jgi:hypothetical protein
MTFANGLKPVVSRVGLVPRTSLNLNFSLFDKVGSGEPKSLMCDMLNGTSPKILATTFIGGGLYDCESIQSLQPEFAQFGCEDSYCEDRKSLQTQHQLSFYMDTKIQEETIIRTGENSVK